MTKLPIQFIFGDVSEGIIQGVKYSLCPENSVELIINMIVDEVIGEAVVRKGSLMLGSQITTQPVLGLYQFIGDLGTTEKLLASVYGSTYGYTSSVFSEVNTGDNNTASVEYETFLDEVVRVNGVNTPETSPDGLNWGTSLSWDTANMPIGKFVKVYKDQVIVAGVPANPDTLYISSVPSSGRISWTSDNREIVVNPEDGQNITGLGEVSSLLIVFKDHAMYRWNNRSTDADMIVNIGCSSQKSIVNCGSALAFFNEKGFWLTSGEQPIKISRKIQKFIEGRTSTFAVPCYGNEDYLYGSLGTCVVNGTTYDNVVVRYSMLSKEWVVYKYPFEIRAFARYTDTTDKIVVGTSLGKIIWIENKDAYDDDGTEIGFEIETHDIDFGSQGLPKEISEMVLAYCRNPYSMIIQYKANNEQWNNFGVLDKEIGKFAINEGIKGNYFKFRAVGLSKNRTRFQGLELTNVSITGY